MTAGRGHGLIGHAGRECDVSRPGRNRLTGPLRLGLVPVVADADVDGERRVEA